MSPLDALRLMVEHYPGGRASFAPRMNICDEVLRKKLAGTGDHALKLSEATLINQMCGELRTPHCEAYATAVAGDQGDVLRLAVPQAEPGPVNLQRTMSDVIKEMSDVATSTIAADFDGVISDNDLAAGLREIDEARAALQLHERALRTKNAAGKPAHEREGRPA